MARSVIVERLSGHRDLVPLIASWFQAEWPDWYGTSGKGSAHDDVLKYASAGGAIPFGVVAFRDGVPCGFGALKNDAIPPGSDRGPWVGAGYVLPELRGQGIGALVLRALTGEARRLGFLHVYCGTSTSTSLLRREGWRELEVVPHEGAQVVVFQSPA
jgi:GNAT superfamily N-acetyltransferase